MAKVSASQVRAELVRALQVDLVGPYEEDEELDRAPSRFYLTGFIVPRAGRVEEPVTAADEDTDGEGGEGEDADDDGAEDARPAGQGSRRPSILPASLGLSVLLPPVEELEAGATDEVTVVLRCAEYVPFHPEGTKKTTRPWWRRVVHAPIELPVPLATLAGGRSTSLRVPALPGVSIELTVGVSSTPRPGTRALSVFVINGRNPEEAARGRRDEQYLFQVELAVRYPLGFQPRPALRRGRDLDDQISSLQYRHVSEYGVGHGVAVELGAEGEAGRGGRPTLLRTTWIPRSEVRRVDTSEVLDPGDPTLTVVRSMTALGQLTDGGAVRAALADLPVAYGRWIERQAARAGELSADDRTTLATLVEDAGKAQARIAEGIELLAHSVEARRAFALANQAMADQATRRLGLVDPSWRLFQLAFVLLTLPSVFDGEHPDREVVELIFFPTGGGKTEAYLGVIAFTMLVRRMRGQERPDGGRGVAVILRYTLRLLTLDQLERAAAMVCALEVLRRQHPAELGGERFAVGLWVGAGATANTMSELKTSLGEYRKGTGESPCPLEACPRCGTKLTTGSLTLDDPKKPLAVVIGCVNDRCEFCPARHRDGLPVVFVDEQVYRELPAFLIGTVDKFAMLPWRAEAGMLFGQVMGVAGRRAIAHGESFPRGGATRLPHGYLPPELIVQDELHLISGPLGTLVGLYETAVELLASRAGPGGAVTKPKVIASTATVRRAGEQVRALMGRPNVRAFPPQGPDPGETFFAHVDGGDGRLYLGVAAPGRAFRAVQARVYQVLLNAAQKHVDPTLPEAEDQPADAYLTLVGYFNALRELGAMRRVVEDEVPQRTAKLDGRGTVRQRKAGLGHPLMAPRTLDGPIELTSRESTAKVKQAKHRLAVKFKPPFTGDARGVDVVLASNMISVGVDIDRLGLMVVAGQPTTSSEYIQATSRVGRNRHRPGLVVTCYNMRRMRDRSYFERFVSYHQSFYGWVEATSVTPFSQPALDRALAAVLVAMVRHGDPALSPASGAMQVGAHRAVIARAVAALRERAGRQVDADAEGLADIVARRAQDLADSWCSQVDEARAENIKRGYSRFDLDKKGLARPLLMSSLDVPLTPVDAKFVAPTSMRDTEPAVHLWLRYGLGRKQV